LPTVQVNFNTIQEFEVCNSVLSMCCQAAHFAWFDWSNSSVCYGCCGWVDSFATSVSGKR